MRQLHISDQLYQDILRHGKDSGFDNIDEYAADILEHYFAEPEISGFIFSPERLAEIAEAAAEMDAGQGISSEEVHEYFRRKSGIK